MSSNEKTAQQSVPESSSGIMHLTGGILRHFRALSTPEQNPAPGVLSTPAHPQVTQTVGQFLANESYDVSVETMTIIFETSRLILRHLELNDLNDLYKLYSDSEIRKYFPDGVLTLAETREELEWYINGHPDYPELGLWATIHKETGIFIGRCGLLPWEIEGEQEVEIAYLLDKLFWHQGLATEAAQGLLEYGFEKLNLSRLICMMAPENSASQKVAQRVGMSLERKVDGIAADNFLTLVYAINKPYTS